jgi:hypothetical protein
MISVKSNHMQSYESLCQNLTEDKEVSSANKYWGLFSNTYNLKRQVWLWADNI